MFSAAAGEFGILFCLVPRGADRLHRDPGADRARSGSQSLFARLAVSTLAIQFGLQCAINLAVNLNLIPPKGMTLPFVSYGGTSMIAIAFGMGLMLALTRTQARGADGDRASGLSQRGGRPRRMSLFVLMAGGTGGHLFPAMALAQELRRRGHDIHLMTDHRVAAYGDQFPGARDPHRAVGDAVGPQSAQVRALPAFKIAGGIARRAAEAAARSSPMRSIGFGGYPVFPPFLAASLLRHPRHPARAERRDGAGQPRARGAGRRASR